ncbi:MAG: TrmH family RNA methyltransferase [Bacteroidia bacterium]
MLSKNQVKQIQSLHLKKNRVEQGLFIAEGPKLSEEIIGSRIKVREIFALKNWLEKNHEAIHGSIAVTSVAEEELKKISTLSTPNQVVVICEIPHAEIDYTLVEKELTVFLDDIRDPGNLGTIIRVADWFGLSQVICSEECVEVYSPKTIMSSMGSISRVNVVTADFAEVKRNLQDKGKHVPVYGAVLSGENIYSAKDLSPGLLVIGNESNGISEKVMRGLTHRIKIPSSSKNGAESLNAAIAASLVIAEFFRRQEHC